MTDLIGKNIRQYQIIDYIARGDSAYVYKGFQASMNRYVAVKVLTPPLTHDEKFVRQFKQEAELRARLEHRYILPVYDYGQQDDILFQVSDYVEGGTLRDRLTQYDTPRNALNIIQPISEALDYIHSERLVHGNLKPPNVLVNPQGQPLLTDFGLGQYMGNLAQSRIFLSPEQKEEKHVDGRADIYALGVILYEMLVGYLPAEETLPELHISRPDLPINIEKIILKATAKYPEYRFQTAGQFSAALRAASNPDFVADNLLPELDSGPISAPSIYESDSAFESTTSSQPASSASSKKAARWVIILLGSTVILLILLALFLILLRIIN